ncbi:MAG TPA: YebC/PmpR family DNA-binding transcriptional regulator [Gemmatales bacterium]|nr:YebC/PmpR family DNA-binding transcriptional regulator [Gemmatales bacterium]HMP59871.1 YebC/PmpR family DNA-binding transcriptional regulator [Gemmatales bacterium]
MAGHSHWANIQRTKGVADARRGRLFSKLSRYILIAARNGGGDPDANLKLRYAIDKARANSMPKENIERAIKKGTGELEGEALEELTYEGYGPGGVAVLAESLTDNRARTSGEVRKIFEKGGGKMGNPGAVAWMFDRKGLIVVDAALTDEESLLDLVADAGGDDVKNVGKVFEIVCDPSAFAAIQEALAGKGLKTTSAEFVQLAKSPIDISLEDAKRVVKLMEMLDEHDDVQNVYVNANLPEEALTATD